MAEKRLKVPQISPNGVSEDYINEICGLVATIEVYKEMKLDWFYKVNKIQRYEERFPPQEYANVINNRNRSLIERINSTAQEINEMLDAKSRNIPKYKI